MFVKERPPVNAFIVPQSTSLDALESLFYLSAAYGYQ
ncbi:hypothetical protein TNIN_129851, partial [Trichonephila inaurata madagascariensis]